MGTSGKVTAMGRYRYPRVSNVLLGGGTRGLVVQIVILGHVGGNDKDSGGNSYHLPKVNHGEEGPD